MPKITSTYRDSRNITILDPDDDGTDYTCSFEHGNNGRFCIRLEDFASGDAFEL